MDQVTSSPNTSHIGDRRRYPRQKPTSLIYVELDSANGGIILDLGIGGLAFQAADKLYVKENLTLKFRLREGGRSVETVGGIAWLAPTQKEAGISFKSLSNDGQQEIAQWIAKQKKVHETTAPPLPSASARNVFARSMPAVSRLTHPEANISRLGVSAKQGSAIPSDALTENAVPFVLPDTTRAISASKDLPNAAKTQRDDDIEKVPKRQWVLPESLSPSRRVGTAQVPLSPALVAARSAPRRRRRTALLAGLAGVAGILVLVLAVVYLGGSRDNGLLQQMPTRPAGSAAPNESQTSSPHAQATVRPYPRSAWTAFLRQLFPGSHDNDKKNLSQDQVSVQVWISKRNGYYYCDGSSDYGAQPGAVVTQGEALQSGYQPKLGDFCF